jgi:uncharacterized repeat protein (TIGR01451 family)
MISWLFRRLAIFLAATLVLFALPVLAAQAPAPASADPASNLTRTVSVTINEIKCATSDCDGIEGFGQGDPDWYAKVFMNGAPASPAQANGPDDTADIHPNWVFSATVPYSQESVDVRVQTWDSDSTSADDLVDDTPQVGDKNLDFKIDMPNEDVEGEASGALYQQICATGNKDDGDGASTVCFTAGNGDRDGDGLLDSWETNGIDFDGNGSIDLPLNQAPYNANPNRKDIFMEIDYMSCAAGGCAAGDTHSHQPAAGALNDVTNAFASAPVGNPDGSFGVTFHPMLDEAIPEINQVTFSTDVAGPNNDFNDIKDGTNQTCNSDGHFGTVADRTSSDCAAILGAKRLFFQYAVFGHSYTENPSSSGISELDPKGGNDLMVTLGGFSAAGIATAGGQRVADASTLMHELGHNLGLHHGGGDDTNCKPNYLSIMNYTLQFPTLDPNRPMTYSSSALPALNENALLPAITGATGRNIVYGQNGNATVAPADGPINWDGSNGSKDDVNYIKTISGCSTPSPGDTNLQGNDDWHHLVYDHSSSSMAQDGVTRTIDNDELTNDEVIAMSPKADLNASKSVDKQDAQAGDTLNYSVTAKNNGPAQAYNVTDTDNMPDGTVQTRNVGQLVSGSSNVQAFTYVVPCNTPDGTVVTNKATVSGTNQAGVNDPNLGDNTASVSTTVHAPKVNLTDAATPSVNPGSSITNTLTYSNAGSSPASNVVVTDVLPAGDTYSAALDQGTGPKPATVVNNANGTTTLTWNVGNVAATSTPAIINFTTRPSLLTLGGTSEQTSVTISYGNSSACSYATPVATSTTAVTDPKPTRNPGEIAYWLLQSKSISADTLAAIQATDPRFDGADGSKPDGVLTQSEVRAVLTLPVGYPRVTRAELLATYLNLATHRINASTKVVSPLDKHLAINNVRDAVLYAQQTLAQPASLFNLIRYGDATAALVEININFSERY